MKLNNQLKVVTKNVRSSYPLRDSCFKIFFMDDKRDKETSHFLSFIDKGNLKEEEKEEEEEGRKKRRKPHVN